MQGPILPGETLATVRAIPTASSPMKTLPIHTVTAFYGIKPNYFECGGKRYDTKGSAPDWIIETVSATSDVHYPLFVTGHHRNPMPGALNRISWSVKNLDDARYDLSGAVWVDRFSA